MSANSQNESTHCSWNPVTGCKNCYAEKTSEWPKGIIQPKYRNGFGLTLHPEILGLPLKWKKPRRICVNSMSDLFHEGVPIDFIHEVFRTMSRCSHHTFQILTKRSKRLLDLSPELPWGPNVWIGVSIESETFLPRMDHLRQCNAHVKFLSLEPLLGPLSKLDLGGIDWVIVGGESGPKARPMKVAWVRDLRDQCLAAHVPFFFKQWGRLSNNPVKDDPTAKENGGEAKGGRMLDGRTWNEMLDFNLPRINGTSPKHQMLFAKRIGGTTPNYGEAYW